MYRASSFCFKILVSIAENTTGPILLMLIASFSSCLASLCAIKINYSYAKKCLFF